MEKIIKITPDKSKASSILKMAEITLEMIHSLNEEKFPSNMVKEYYEIIRELISAIMILDGRKTYGEGSHAVAIEYLGKNYRQFSDFEISLIDEFRVNRNKISYDGFFIQPEYIKRRKQDIETLIKKLIEVIKNRLGK